VTWVLLLIVNHIPLLFVRMKGLLLFALAGCVALTRSFQVNPQRFSAIRVPSETRNHVRIPSAPSVTSASSPSSYPVTTLKQSSSEEWTKSRMHNSNWFRTFALLTTIAAAGYKAPVPAQAASIVHVVAFATWFGSVAYTTFVAGFVLFKNLPRQMFGKLQAKLFPKYFQLSSVMLILQVRLLWIGYTRGSAVKRMFASSNSPLAYNCIFFFTGLFVDIYLEMSQDPL
jgi:hypothetical protein